MSSDYAQRVIDMLSPSIGEYMAPQKVTAACEIAKLDIETIGKPQEKKFCRSIGHVMESLGPKIAEGIRQSVVSL